MAPKTPITSDQLRAQFARNAESLSKCVDTAAKVTNYADLAPVLASLNAAFGIPSPVVAHIAATRLPLLGAR